jgi:tight adherence protein B
MLPILVVVLVVGSVTLSSLAIMSVLARAYARYRERYVDHSLSELSEMFLFVEAQQVLALNLGSMFLLGTVGYLVANLFVAAGATVFGFFLPRLLIEAHRRRRRRRFEVQLTDALQAMSGALKAGLSLPQALEHVAREAQAPLAQEFGLCVKEMKLGLGLEEALVNMGRRVSSDDLDLVVVSANIARSLGGSLAELFETLAGVSRERFRLEGRIDALTSQGRLQGWVVAAMPPALGLVLNALRPDLMAPMLGHVFGWLLVVAVVLLEVVGVLLIRRIVNVAV